MLIIENKRFQLGKGCFAIIKGEEIILHLKSISLDREVLII